MVEQFQHKERVDMFYASTAKLMALETTVYNKEHEAAFRTLLKIPQWNDEIQLKIMASQFISDYAKYFPDLQNDAFNSQIDFCEDDNILVKCEGIKSLASFSLGVPTFSIQSVDVLVQLLQSEVPEEEIIVVKSLLLLFRKFPKDATITILGQISNGTETIRDCACNFIRKQLLNELHVKMKLKFLEKLIPVFLLIDSSEY